MFLSLNGSFLFKKKHLKNKEEIDSVIRCCQLRAMIFIILPLFIIYEISKSNSEELDWPSGSFGLVQPKTGCPKQGDWKSGFTYHNSEDEMNSNSHSQSYHAKGRFTQQGIEMWFCLMDDSNRNTSDWPIGSYCLYKYGKCPPNMKEGQIFWQDEKTSRQIPNHHEGHLPDGKYNQTSTLIKFCCMKNGTPDKPIDLPVDSPFYLFPSEKNCQNVRNTKVSEEWIRFDDDDEGNTDYIFGSVPFGTNPVEDFNIILKMCYYEGIEPIVEKREIKFKENTKPVILNSRSRMAIVGVTAAGSVIIIMGIAGLIINRKYL